MTSKPSTLCEYTPAKRSECERDSTPSLYLHLQWARSSAEPAHWAAMELHRLTYPSGGYF